MHLRFISRPKHRLLCEKEIKIDYGSLDRIIEENQTQNVLLVIAELILTEQEESNLGKRFDPILEERKERLIEDITNTLNELIAYKKYLKEGVRKLDREQLNIIHPKLTEYIEKGHEKDAELRAEIRRRLDELRNEYGYVTIREFNALLDLLDSLGADESAIDEFEDIVDEIELTEHEPHVGFRTNPTNVDELGSIQLTQYPGIIIDNIITKYRSKLFNGKIDRDKLKIFISILKEAFLKKKLNKQKYNKFFTDDEWETFFRWTTIEEYDEIIDKADILVSKHDLRDAVAVLNKHFKKLRMLAEQNPVVSWVFTKSYDEDEGTYKLDVTAYKTGGKGKYASKKEGATKTFEDPNEATEVLVDDVEKLKEQGYSVYLRQVGANKVDQAIQTGIAIADVYYKGFVDYVISLYSDDIKDEILTAIENAAGGEWADLFQDDIREPIPIYKAIQKGEYIEEFTVKVPIILEEFTREIYETIEDVIELEDIIEEDDHIILPIIDIDGLLNITKTLKLDLEDLKDKINNIIEQVLVELDEDNIDYFRSVGIDPKRMTSAYIDIDDRGIIIRKLKTMKATRKAYDKLARRRSKRKPGRDIKTTAREFSRYEAMRVFRRFQELVKDWKHETNPAFRMTAELEKMAIDPDLFFDKINELAGTPYWNILAGKEEEEEDKEVEENIDNNIINLIAESF